MRSTAREGCETIAERREGRGIHPRPLHDLPRDLEREGPQRAAVVGELDLENALIVAASRSRDASLSLEALDERRERRGLHRELVREVAERARRLLPQGEHHEILRMCEPERLEDGPVQRHDVARSGDEGEAELILELQEVVAGIHLAILQALMFSTLSSVNDDTRSSAADRSTLRERVLEIALTDDGRALRTPALEVPGQIMQRTGMDAAALAALRDGLTPFAGGRAHREAVAPAS